MQVTRLRFHLSNVATAPERGPAEAQRFNDFLNTQEEEGEEGEEEAPGSPPARVATPRSAAARSPRQRSTPKRPLSRSDLDTTTKGAREGQHSPSPRSAVSSPFAHSGRLSRGSLSASPDDEARGSRSTTPRAAQSPAARRARSGRSSPSKMVSPRGAKTPHARAAPRPTPQPTAQAAMAGRSGVGVDGGNGATVRLASLPSLPATPGVANRAVRQSPRRFETGQVVGEARAGGRPRSKLSRQAKTGVGSGVGAGAGAGAGVGVRGDGRQARHEVVDAGVGGDFVGTATVGVGDDRVDDDGDDGGVAAVSKARAAAARATALPFATDQLDTDETVPQSLSTALQNTRTALSKVRVGV